MGQGTPRGLLIGLLRVGFDARPCQIQEARLQLALRANDDGYALLETFHVIGDPMKDEGPTPRFEALAQRFDADALLIVGTLDRERAEDIAYRARLVVREMAGP